MNEREIIKKIEEVFDYSVKKSTYSYRSDCDGYRIITNKQEILLLISSWTNCCEKSGYMISEDNFDRFIGSELINIGIVTEESGKIIKIEKPSSHDKDVYALFIDINTNLGILQFALYNIHNGYYGHKAHVICNQINITERL